MLSTSAFNKKPIKDDTRFIVWLIVGFLFVAWLCTPPGNKFLQMAFWGNNAKYFWAKVLKDPNVKEYQHYRDNAIYLAKMYPKNPKAALIAIDKAIDVAPSFVSDEELFQLYKDRATIKLYAGDKKGAFRDYATADNFLGMNDLISVAMLALDEKKYRMAMDYCNRILNIDYQAWLGYGCLAEVYDTYERTDVAIKSYDLALERKQTAKSYAGRAKLKQKNGDMTGYEADVVKAKEYGGNGIDINYSLMQDVLYPKELSLQVGE